METYKFSVIVPVYNVTPYLDRCVQSLLSQEYGAYEVILIDDGSTDGSGDMCDVYAAGNKFVRTFHTENGGLSAARNLGIEKAKGEYLLFVDSDDCVDENMCRTLEQRLCHYEGVDLVSFDALGEDGDSCEHMRRILTDQTDVSEGREYLLQGYKKRNVNVQVWMYAFRKDFLDSEHLRFKEGILHEDVEFMPRVLLKARRVLSVPDVLYHYKIRKGSISTSSDKRKNIEDLFSVLREQSHMAAQQSPQMKKWMLNGILNSYLNMVQEARMDRSEYRIYLDKDFLGGRPATAWNAFRALLCRVNVGWYCRLNEYYKKLKQL